MTGVRDTTCIKVKALCSMPRFPRDGSVATLGYLVAAFIEDYLVQPDGDDAGDPFRLTREQLNFVLWFYAMDRHGRFVYRRAILRRAKGWGKSPFLAAIAIAELVGPTRFGGWDLDGKPIGIRTPNPWVVIAGVSEVQTVNTLDSVRGLLEGSAAVEEFGLDVGLTRVYVDGGGKLIPITASSATQEGARPTFAILDETHHWSKTNGGAKLARTIKRNLAKSRDGMARSIETTNAHEPGENSVAEASYLAHIAIEEGRAPRSTGILYDSREAPPIEDLADEPLLRACLKAAYGDSTWVDIDRFVGEVYDPDTSPEESRRFYLNQIVAAADSWLDPAQYDANFAPDLAPLLPGETVTLGFDGGITDDSTALVAERVSDGAPFIVGLWEKPEGVAGRGWSIDKPVVRDMVDWAIATYRVVAFFSDVAYWETDVDSWRDSYGEGLLVKATTKHAIAYDMRSHGADITRAVEALHRAYTDHEAPHNGDPRLRRHVLNARRREGRFGITFGKETRESPKKVDALAARLLARMAHTRLTETGALKDTSPGTIYGFD